MKRRAWFAGALAALAIVACTVPGGRTPASERLHTAAGRAAAAAAPIAASVQRDGERATIALTVHWPPRDRTLTSIPPGAERVTFKLEGDVPADLTIPPIDRPSSGTVSSKTIYIEIPWKLDLNVRVRATAFGTSAVLAQSVWTRLDLKRNAKIDAPIELFPASGADADSAHILQPVITKITPERGYPGSNEVTLSGLNFGYSKGPSSAVLFGGVEAAEPALWTDSAQGATIKIAVPAGARSGPVSVRLGKVADNLSATWSPAPTAGDPWSGKFNVLGPEAEPATYDNGASGAIADYRLAYDAKLDRWWVAFTRAVTLASGKPGYQLAVGPIATETLKPALFGTRVVAAAPDINVDGKIVAGVQLGGLVVDPDINQAWTLWQESSGSTTSVRIGRVTGAGGTSIQLDPVSTHSAATSFPALALNGTRTLMATWIDIRDTGPATRIHPRIYSRTFSADSATFSAPVRAVQSSNTFVSGDTDTLALVGAPHIASDGDNFLIAWVESFSTSLGLRFQRMIKDGRGAESQNVSKSTVSRSLEEPQLYWSVKDSEYLVAYVNRQGDMFGTSSDIYLESRDTTGAEKAPTNLTQVADDERTLEGRKQCPGSPCGQGSRTRPQIFGNGRDLMLAWQFDRNDGEVDVVGARMQRGPTGTLARAPEEAGKLAELLYSSQDGGGSRSGAQKAPRLSWGKERLLVGWLESGALYLRTWR